MTTDAMLPGSIVACDTETTGLRSWLGDAPFAVSFCDENGNTDYVEWCVEPFTREVLYSPRGLEKVRLMLGDPDCTYPFFNAKFDIRMLEQGPKISVRGRIEEVMFAAHCCNTIEPNYRLKPLADKYAGCSKEDETELKAAVISARKIAKEWGWNIGEAVEQDYWLLNTMYHNCMARRIPAGWDLPALEARLGPEFWLLCKKYCVMDSERTMLLWMMYQEAMISEGVRDTYDTEMRLWPINYEMETRGVAIDPIMVLKLYQKHHEERIEREQILYDIAGKKFNVNSAPQLGEIMYGKFNLAVNKRTVQGQASTGAKALAKHVDHPFVRAMLLYRAAEKAETGFFGKYKELMCADPLVEDGWVLHADFNQVGPKTGRYSCRTPNLQNVANALTARGLEPVQARTPFHPRPGYSWAHLDYSQLEVRIFADVGKVGTMLDAIDKGLDVHTATANKAWGGKNNPAAIRAAIQALELRNAEPKGILVAQAWQSLGWDGDHSHIEETAERWLSSFDYDIVAAETSLKKAITRSNAKMLIFLKVFGGGVDAAADLIGCSKPEAKGILHDYDTAFPEMGDYMKLLSVEAKQNGYIRNRYNRKLRVDPSRVYTCVNYMVQGSAADLVKRSMIRVADYIKSTGLDAHMIMTIHDEIVVEIRNDHWKKWFLRGMQIIMEDHEGHFNVPLPVEVKRVVKSWDVKEKVDLGYPQVLQTI